MRQTTYGKVLGSYGNAFGIPRNLYPPPTTVALRCFVIPESGPPASHRKPDDRPVAALVARPRPSPGRSPTPATENAKRYSASTAVRALRRADHRQAPASSSAGSAGALASRRVTGPDRRADVRSRAQNARKAPSPGPAAADDAVSVWSPELRPTFGRARAGCPAGPGGGRQARGSLLTAPSVTLAATATRRRMPTE
jgi:hypothetical protein